MVTRAVIMEVKTTVTPATSGVVVFTVSYRILKRGRKKTHYTYVAAKDELDAYMQVTNRLKKRGYSLP